jgi:hypothetical protein
MADYCRRQSEGQVGTQGLRSTALAVGVLLRNVTLGDEGKQQALASNPAHALVLMEPAIHHQVHKPKFNPLLIMNEDE